MDKLSFVVAEEGLHLVSMVIALITASDAATSHFVRPIISVTIPTGDPAIAGVAITAGTVGGDLLAGSIADADGALVESSAGFDAKGGGASINAAVCVPVLAQLGSTITLQFGHTITGACADGGTYRIGMSVVKL